ncbi:retrovirus-related pol polyprotein from transposon TNT 1-94 [Tanacetum coccineum]
MLAPKCPTFNGRPTFANPRYLKKAQNEIPCLYAIPHDQSDPANRLVPDREETQTLEEESRSKLNKDLVKPFDYTKLNKCVSKDVMCSYLQSSSDLDEITELQCLYLHKVRECDCLAQKLSEQTEFVSKEIYTELLQSFAKLEKYSISLEIALQECQEQLKNDTVCKEKASNVFQKEREQYFEIQDLKAQLQDKNIAISELKKLIEKCKGKYVDTKFDKPSVVRQPNAQRIPKPSVLGKPAPFSDSLERKYFAKKKSVSKTNESEGLSKPILYKLPQTATQAVSRFYNSSYCMLTLDAQSTCRAIYLSVAILVEKILGNITIQKGLLTSKVSITIFSRWSTSVDAIWSSNPVSLRKHAPTQAWLWHQRLSHLNFDYINLLSKKDVVIGLPKLKYVKDQLCSSCEVSKAKRSSFKSKTVPSSKRRATVSPNDKTSDYDNPDPAQEIQMFLLLADTNSSITIELDLLFGPLYDEFFNDGTSRVNKSSSPTDNSAPQDTHPLTNIHPTTIPSTLTKFNAEENNNDQAEIPKKNNIKNEKQGEKTILSVHDTRNYCSSSRNIGTMADSAWIEAKQEEHPSVSDRLQDWELVDKPLGKNGIDFEESFAPVARLEAVRFLSNMFAHNLFKLSNGRENDIILMAIEERFIVAQPDGSLIPDHPDKVTIIRNALYN